MLSFMCRRVSSPCGRRKLIEIVQGGDTLHHVKIIALL